MYRRDSSDWGQFDRSRPGSETSLSSYFWSIFLHFPSQHLQLFISTFGLYFLCSGDPAFLSWFPWAVSVIQCKPPFIATAILEWQQLSSDAELLPGTQGATKTSTCFLNLYQPIKAAVSTDLEMWQLQLCGWGASWWPTLSQPGASCGSRVGPSQDTHQLMPLAAELSGEAAAEGVKQQEPSWSLPFLQPAVSLTLSLYYSGTPWTCT